MIGLSKLPRIVDMFARRLQIQERPTRQVAPAVREVIKPLGVGLICEGAFRDRKETRDEFLALVNHRGNGH